ncbi:hypothetical protein [Gluconobacter cerinus]|nr:hypothetical protein [Gluconobacter cerinus]MBS0983794.1 hypothetical protein [Gluconobacter cerinus]
MSNSVKKFSAVVRRVRAVRLVLEHEGERRPMSASQLEGSKNPLVLKLAL